MTDSTDRPAAPAQHTPGPWEIVQAHARSYIYAEITSPDDNPDDIEVAQVARPADARLIAAAPQMLAALKLCALYNHDGDLDILIRDAIAAAQQDGGEL